MGHNKPTDWWALGVLIYEMMVGFLPFRDKQMINMYKKILRQPVEFPESLQISEEAKDLIRKLLVKNPKQRLGAVGGGDEILAHPWY